MFGCIHKPYPMRWTHQKSGPRINGVQYARFAFHSEILVDVTLFGHKSHEGFGFVGVELIAHEEPFPFGVNAEGLFDVLDEIHLGAGASTSRG